MKVIFETIQFARKTYHCLAGRCPASLSCLIAASFLLVSAETGNSLPLTFTTLAGHAGQGSSNGVASIAQFQSPRSVAVDASTNVYVADTDNHVIRKITVGGVVTTFAGSPGIHGTADNSGTNALFFRPEGIAVDSSGNLFVADTGNHTIRKITSAGVVTTFAGSAGNEGSLNNSGTNASFSRPSGIAVGTSGNLFVADTGNHTIRKITPAGAVTTFVGSAGISGNTDNFGANALFSGPQGITADASGNLFVADTGNGTIRKVTTGGLVTTIAGSPGNYGSTNSVGTNALFFAPQGIVVDGSGTLYVADTGNSTVRKINLGGLVTTLVGSPGKNGGQDGTNGNARLWSPQGIAADATGNLYVADTGNNTVRKVTSAGIASTLAGSPSFGSTDGIKADARFAFPQAIAVDAATNVFIADTANHTIRKIVPSGLVTTLAGSSGNSGTLNNTGTNALFNGPQGVAADNAGNVFVADTVNHVIRKIAPGGIVSTFAGSVGIPGTADGTNTGAQFYAPQSLTVDGSGNVFVADTFNNLIRKITPAGVVTTIAGSYEFFGSSDGTNRNARFYWPAGIAVDGLQNLFVADYFNHTIRRLTPAGTNWVVTTLAGLAGFWGNMDGTNGEARFFGPRGISVDTSGALYVSDSGNHTIRKLTPSGTNWITSTEGGLAGVAGNADGTGTSARFFHPAGIAASSAGVLYVADADNNSLRFDGLVQNPQLFNLVVTPFFNSAFISWDTSVPCTSQIFYGLTQAYDHRTSLDSNLRTSHSFLLSGLATNADCYFQIVCASVTNQFSVAGSFSTLESSIIVDALHAAYAGVWTINTAALDKYSSYYKYASSDPSGNSAQAIFRPNISIAGGYDVYVWYPAGTNCSAHVPVLNSSTAGELTTYVDQTFNGGSWQLVASDQYYSVGSNGFVQIGNDTGESDSLVMADAVKWVYNPGQDASSNGLVPGWWSTFYIGTSTTDGSVFGANGRTLYENYLFGLNPADPNSHLNVRIAPLNSGLQVTFSPWQGGRTYQLVSTTNLADPVWTVVPGSPMMQNSYGEGLISFTNSIGPKTFYRLLVSPAP